MSFDDEKRFENLLGEFVADKKANLVNAGRNYVTSRASCLRSENQALGEIMWGFSQMNTVAEYKKRSAAENLRNFARIYNECLAAGGIIHVTADKDSLAVILPLIKDFSNKAGIKALLPAKKFPLQDYVNLIYQKEEALSDGIQVIKVDSQTGYAAAVSSASGYLTKESASDAVFASWVSNHTFWDRLRTTGGAYGAGMWVDSIQNTVYFSTYRDPSPEHSVEVFRDSMKELAENPVSDEDVEQTVVSSYASLIQPAAPKDKASRSFEGFLFANPSDFRQKRVENLLSVTADDVAASAHRFGDAVEKDFRAAVFCDKSKTFSGNIINLPL